ncbi:MAG: rod shape-determining protein RodA [Lachnospiraceae bacterium]|nr:rod shape-determining protein RodA [Lachnospiraceae bacterium]
MFKYYKFKDYDFKLILYLCTITVLGILLVNSAQPDNTKKQLMGFVAGLAVLIILSFIDYHIWLKIWFLYYFAMIALLLAVLLKGDTSLGAKRWFTLFGIRFQPSEAAKILLILFFAQFIMKFKERINQWYMIAIMCILAVPPVLLIFKQPDLSTTIVFSLIFISLLYLGEINYRYFIALAAVAIPAFIIVFIILIQPNSVLVKKEIVKPYQQLRILAWLHPDEYELEEAFQQQNSIMAIGSGQLTGKGLNNTGVNSVKKGNFISEPQTDFIFTIAGEELGFVGSATIIILLILITIECFIVAFKAPDLPGRIIAGGMGAYIGFQSTINICVTTGLFPNTGLPLPFVSYGLTSLLVLYIGMGFVMNVRLQRSRKQSKEENNNSKI